ncbi:MAG TPA: hypothetical protein VEL79_19900 [Vicinamibacterales bacterium]|nr:hypothetical protein [Vicinamibacterales bacterium]
MRRISIAVFVLALVNSAFGLLSKGAVNARALGAHDLGIAIASAYGTAFSLIVGLFAAPVLLLAAGAALFADRRTAFWLLAAAIVSAIPFVIFALQGR